jgi:hypothetical protein
MEVFTNSDTPKCVVYNGKTQQKIDDLKVPPLLRKPPNVFLQGAPSDCGAARPNMVFILL